MKLVKKVMISALLLSCCIGGFALPVSAKTDDIVIQPRIPADTYITRSVDYGDFGKYTFNIRLTWSSSKNTYVFGSYSYSISGGKNPSGVVYINKKTDSSVQFLIHASCGYNTAADFKPTFTW